MKALPTILILLAFCSIISCKKGNYLTGNYGTKTIKFVLYTDKDFSTDEDTISFRLFVQNNAGTINLHTIFDSTLATRRIKDIPGPLNKLVFEKKVPDNGTILKAGFVYSTQYGISWHIDTVGVSERSKVIEYPFQ